MDKDGKVLLPVHSEQQISKLREYRRFLQSTMGPSGSCKVIVTEGGYLEVINASSALVARLDLADPICKYINNLVAGLADHGFYFGVLLSHLLEQYWQESTIPKTGTMQMISVLAKELETSLFSVSVCLKLSFDSIQNFLPVVQTIITSKCPVFLSGMDIERLCVEITKVFLNCVDDETNVINRVYTKVESGSNKFISYKGLLYTVSENQHIDVIEELTGDVKILVFALKLEDSDELSLDVEEVKQLIGVAIESGIKVVACQKTVSPEIKLFLRRRKTILLERMGSDFTSMLIYISKAFPISHLNIKETEIGNFTGHLSLVKLAQFSEHNYLVLHNENLPVGTLLVQTSSLLGKDSIKTLIQQALTALRTIAVHSRLALGGGCLETWIIGRIHLMKEDSTEREFGLVSSWMQRAMQSLCGAAELDTVFHHAWREGGASCGCGLVGRAEVEQRAGIWLTVQEVVSSPVRLRPPQQPNMTLRPDVKVESHHQKLQTICSAIEAFSNLSNIGLILQ